MPLDILTRNGGRTSLSDETLAALAGRLRGEVVRPTDAAYESARKVWNGMIDRKPALIVRCRGTADVLHTVDFVRERNLLLSIRAGGTTSRERPSSKEGW